MMYVCIFYSEQYHLILSCRNETNILLQGSRTLYYKYYNTTYKSSAYLPVNILLIIHSVIL